MKPDNEQQGAPGLEVDVLEGRRLRLTWRPLNPDAGGGPDDYLLEDQHRRIYAHAEEVDNDTWWACVYPMEAWEDPHFTGGDAKDKAFRYCEEMVHLWHSIRGRVAELDKLTAPGRAEEYATRFDVRTTELPMPKQQKGKDLP